MEINRQNYEQVIIDFIDGKLNEEQIGILMSFLDFNPDLKEEFTGIEKMCLEPETETYAGKENLLRSGSDLTREAILKDFDMYCISSMENDIAEEDEAKLQEILQDDPDREEVFRLYQSARLLPDESIIYHGKATLKKRFIGKTYRVIMPAAAAVAVLLIMLQIFISRDAADQNLAETYQPTPGHEEMEENPKPIAEKARVPVETPLPTREEKSHVRAGVNDDNVPRDTSAPKEKGGSQREAIRLARVEPKFSTRIVRSDDGSGEFSVDYLKVRQSANNTGYGDSAGMSGANSRLSLWILADAGVRGLNSVSEDMYHLDREKDENGETRRITFDTPVFGISAPLRKSDRKR
jgi:hypothetical protein